MERTIDVETEILTKFDYLQKQGIPGVGLLMSYRVRTELEELLANTDRIAALDSNRRSRLALMPHFIVKSYPGRGYRVGPLGDITREWKEILEMEKENF